MKLSAEIRQQLVSLGNDRNIWMEGSILKLLDDCDGEFKEYITTAIDKDSERRKKRLEITKQVQEKNKELQEKASENENLMVELKDALETASIVEEDEPVSMFESTKVFIGKRHHQTEKPQDILEFFLKYWSDENDTILDPTMGSGSTGVACAKLNRNFIGCDINPKAIEITNAQ